MIVRIMGGLGQDGSGPRDGTPRPGSDAAVPQRAARHTDDRRHDDLRPEEAAPRDSVYFFQLARQARRLAASHADPVAARRLRETAIRHEKTARRLQREEASANGESKLSAGLTRILRHLRGRG